MGLGQATSKVSLRLSRETRPREGTCETVMGKRDHGCDNEGPGELFLSWL